MDKDHRVGIIHGRFQPPHNGHIRYMLLALEKAEHLLIGICTPAACTEEEAARTGYPCAPRLNPFTFDERMDMIKAALSEAGISSDRYSFIDFPSDYQTIETLVPENAVFLMSVTGQSDTEKIAHLEKLGFQVETIISIPEDSDRESGGGVRESARRPDETWEKLVPKSIAQYMKEHDLVKKLAF